MALRPRVLGVTIRARGGEAARLLSWPRPYPENPYLGRLADALAGERITTLAHRSITALALAPRRARWLHVHWPEWIVRDVSRARTKARTIALDALFTSLRLRGVRLAWTAHNLVGHDEPHPDLAQAARRALLARCDVVFGHFAEAEHDVRDLGFRGRFALTPHPGLAQDHPPTGPRDEARRTLGLPATGRVLLAFGALDPYKGFEPLVRAFVRDAPSDTTLCIAGRASSNATLRTLRDAAAGDRRVRIDPGFVSPARTSQYFSAADALVLSYRSFYTSGTAMLALSLGTPVLGPPRHHLRAFAGQPFFVPMESPESLGAALTALDALPADAGDAASRYAATCTWARAAATIRRTLWDESGNPA